MYVSRVTNFVRASQALVVALLAAVALALATDPPSTVYVPKGIAFGFGVRVGRRA